MGINGILDLYKPAGITSQTAVNKVKRLFGAEKAGHCGTLDPMAEGVLPVMLGGAVKASEYLVDHDKHYRAEFVPGKETDSGDTTGNIINEYTGPLPGIEDIRKAAGAFSGEYMQTPPMYSALKIGGRKLVDLAREGLVIDRKPRMVHIYKLDVFKMEERYYMEIHCSRGTYIRTLCSDIGLKLGCFGCMGSLVRTRVGGFDISESYTFEELEAAGPDELISFVTATDKTLEMFGSVILPDFYSVLIQNGCAVDLKKLGFSLEQEILVRLYDKTGFLGLGSVVCVDGVLCLKRIKKIS